MLTTDRFGTEDAAYAFDGQDDGIQVAVAEVFSVHELTLSAWIAIEGPGTWNPRIVGVGPQGTSHQHYVLVQEGSLSFGRRLSEKGETRNSWYGIFPRRAPRARILTLS